jgi:sortase A
VFREVPLLVKVGVIMMALALALVIAAVVVRVTVGSEPERVVPAEVAKTSPGEAPRYASGQEGSATKKSFSEKDSTRYPSGKQEESLGYDSSSSSSGEPVGQKKEEANEPQAVLQQEAEPQSSHSTMPQQAGNQTPSEAPSAPSKAPSDPEPQPQQHQTQPVERPLPGSEQRDWPEPTQGELNRANQERHYELLPGAIMGLTIEALGIHDAPVFDSDSRWALANGVAHNPQTSLPWSPSPQRNVYLPGHRMGFRGTWSRMIFYNLHKLKRGDKVVLRDRAGRSYIYRVSEVFITDPKDVWVMGQVRGRDMVTLQTCTPIPTFEKRLIMRADRV